MTSIAIGLGASIIAFLIMHGFQETVKSKIYSFSGHLLVTPYTITNTPLNFKVDAFANQGKYTLIKHIQEYALKVGLVKTEDEEVLGVSVKGVGKSFDQETFRSSIIDGRFLDFPDSSYAHQVVLSKTISEKLNANVGDDIVVHFFQNPPRYRKLQVVGIYETNLSEYFDDKVIFSDIRMIQKLNDWNDSLADGLEVFVKDVNRIDDAGYQLADAIPAELNIERVSDLYMQVFEWLHLLSRQVNILLGIILTVVCVNMISIVLILVMERTQMIGMLKALGAGDRLIRSVFIYNGVNLIFKGLLLGNILGLGLCYLQYKFGIMKLNAHDYYMSVVPISWHWEVVIALNLITFFVVTTVLLLPTLIIARISPIKAIRFD